MSTITSVKITDHPFGYTDVVATMDDGDDVHLFNFYSDELSFNEHELVGLTVDQARARRHQRDVEYLQA